MTILLLGNKSDCAERVVKAEEGEILAKVWICGITSSHTVPSLVLIIIKHPLKPAVFLPQEYNFEFMECSAATGENVLRSLETVAR